MKPNFINAYVLSKSEIKTTYSLKINDEKEAQFGKTFQALPHKTQKTQPFLRAFCSLSYSPDNHQIKKQPPLTFKSSGREGTITMRSPPFNTLQITVFRHNSFHADSSVLRFIFINFVNCKLPTQKVLFASNDIV